MSVDAREYVSATAGPSITSRARRSPLLFVGVTLFVIIIVLLVTQSRPADYRELSTENASPNGTRALAQILRGQGVDVRQINLLGDAHIADPARTTLVIADPGYLLENQLDSVAGYPGDVVFLGVSQQALDTVDARLYLTSTFSEEQVLAGCGDPDATAAETTTTGQDAIAGDDLSAQGALDAALCFPDAEGTYSYARVSTELGTRTFLANPAIATNEQLDQFGNAALALRVTGAQENLIWYVGDYVDSTILTWGDNGPTATEVELSADFLPPGTTEVLFALALAALVAAFWRARRFGPLVTEPLPVVVRSSEATRGRARLYRRARATGRSTAAIRGLVALRIGKRLGVPRAAGRDGLVQAITRATGREAAEIDTLFYGPPPANETDMMLLVQRLDQLESEVHRP
ncbi:DUF4350 domain-containing protein [Demequina aurantiaca]|uniref:DUF4350 domain-containing protein n=1 Tax=Demequina aurantiaca TaxID=676200 RepID=UPI003D32F36E